MDKKISHIISDVCKQAGITYKSVNPGYIRFRNDAKLLVKLCRDLKIISNNIKDIATRHSIPGLKEMIICDVDVIKTVDHDLIKMARQIEKEQK